MTTFLALPIDDRLSSANLVRYSPIVHLLDNHRPSIWEGEALMQAFKDALQHNDFDPAADFIALTGKAVYLAVLVAAVWEYMDANYPTDTGVSFLVYDAGPGLYKEMRLPRARK